MSERKVVYTPMIEQYLDIKEEYKDTILFYRVGDFYEMFFDDAILASKELEIALTGKDAGVEERIPMCGVPFHAFEPYAEKLVSKGYKVGIVEQIEDPKEAKGLVKRGVIKIITPGTIDSGLNEKENNYIASIVNINKEYILCYSDLTTGEGYVAKFNSFDILVNEILSLRIKEVVVNVDFNKKDLDIFVNNNRILLTRISNVDIPTNLLNIVQEIEPIYHQAVGMLINYYIKTKKQEPNFFKVFKNFINSKYLKIDAFTKRNLEITETLRMNNKNGSLLWHLDKCETAMGSRMLRKWLDKPLMDVKSINERLDFIECFNDHYLEKNEIKEDFKSVYDLERIIGRIASGNANAKDLGWLRKSLRNIPNVKTSLYNIGNNVTTKLANSINDHRELFELLDSALVDNPPLIITEGGMIKEGFDSNLDEIKAIQANSKEWILNYEQIQREKTGIKTLKVGYNRVTGYYIEVTKANIPLLPDDIDYERRATLVNSERFISKELKEYEDIVLHSKEQIESLEYEIFTKLRNITFKYVVSLQELADMIATIDCYISLSDIAVKYNYVRPTFNNERKITIVDGRHPVLETILTTGYIVNDVDINTYNMMLITGPNMSGKSTYMRMLATILVMAQIGSFVPAKVANLMIFDSIFTRIGASDDLMSGQSTFMVEMMEANYAITNATKDSLILFDEIGRGTATYDGMALAQAILEYVHEKIGCITLFSTHYHELTALDQTLKRLKNVHVEAKEVKDGVTFLHKVLDGPADKSYGINVASLAGLPKSLIQRGKIILESLESEKNKNNIKLDLFNFDAYENQPEVVKETKGDELIKRLDEIDVNKITPLEALKILYELKEL